MRFSIREAELFADKNNFIPDVSYIFIEPTEDGGYYAFTYPYDPQTKNPVSYKKLSVAKASSLNGIMGEVHEFQQNYGLGAGILTKNEQGQWERVKVLARVNYRVKILKALDEHSENIGSPKVSIEPSSPNVDEAIRILESKAPEVLKQVTDIKTNLTKDVFGEFSSDSPHTLHLNLQKIENEVRNKLSGQSEEEIKKELINQIALVISHESGHQHAFNGTKDTSEAPAEQREKEVSEKIKQ